MSSKESAGFGHDYGLAYKLQYIKYYRVKCQATDQLGNASSLTEGGDVLRNRREVQIHPVFRSLSSQQIRQIHSATLDVLERTGVEIYDQEALTLLRQAGGYVTGVNVRIPASLVEWAIESAPNRVKIWSRDGLPALELSSSNVYFGPGPSCPNVLDIVSGERRLVEKQDLIAYAHLCEGLSNIDFMMSMGILADTPEISDLQEFVAMVLNTKKPIVAWAWNDQGAQDILDISLAFRKNLEDLRQRPFYLLYCEPTAPLRHAKEAIQKLLFTAERGLPLIYGAGPVGGASAPVTLEGMILEGNAEVLSGLVIAQLKRAGTPFIYGSGTGPLDMSTMTVAYGAPEFILGQAVFAELARFYGIPSWGFGGCSDSKVPDEQMAIQSTLWNLVSALSGANLVHDVGFIESGMTGSMEAIVINDEIIGMIKRLLGGIKFSEEEFALDTIHEVGPGGNFLGTEHTFKNFRKTWNPGLVDRSIYATWVANGKTTMGCRAREKAKELLSRPSEIHTREQELIQSIVDRASERNRKKKQR